MREAVVNWQGFETWTPEWDVIAILGIGVVVVVALILLGSFGKREQ